MNFLNLNIYSLKTIIPFLSFNCATFSSERLDENTFQPLMNQWCPMSNTQKKNKT
jgi:hypothetical protein